MCLMLQVNVQNKQKILLQELEQILRGKRKLAASYRNARDNGIVREGAIAWLQTCGFFHAGRMPDNGDMMLPFKTWKSI